MFLLRPFSRIVLLFTIVVIIGCASQGEKWPMEIVGSMWIPDDAKVTERYHHGIYFVAYTLDVCYPATAIIDDMDKKMYTKGWMKLPDDPLNPSLDPSNSSVNSWHHTFDDLNQPIHTRRDFWRDDKKNVIEYSFSYGNKYGKRKKYEECRLDGSSKYIPEGLLHKAIEKAEQIKR
jgi:hypothetical protein